MTPQLSVVIASFDSAPWLPSTLAALGEAISRSDWTTEVIVVDDGSTDDTQAVLEAAMPSLPSLRVVTQQNRGRFLARWAGIETARAESVLLLDSRVLVRADALAYLEKTVVADPSAAVWNGHVDTDPLAPLVGRFWEVPTHIFWADYLRRPRPFTIDSRNFDRVPKGTGFFFAPKALLRQVMQAAWPEGDARLVSDDTKVLRRVVEQSTIRLDPGFAAVYRPRVTVRGFLSHARDRGTLFIDSYAGTSVVRSVVLVGLIVLPPVLLFALIVIAALGAWPVAVALVVLAVLAAAAPAVIAPMRAASGRAVLAYFVYLVPFGAVFWAGLARGAIMHRRSFGRTRGEKERG